MKLYRWYSEEICMGGVTASFGNETEEDVVAKVEGYIVNTFDDMKFAPQNIEDLRISVWLVEEDDDYNECYPMTVATHY